MKLIGVMGNSGSGKTTFTEYLETKPSVGVVHVDLITADIKKKYFKPFLQPREKNTTESTIITSRAPERASASAISRACSPLSG